MTAADEEDEDCTTITEEDCSVADEELVAAGSGDATDELDDVMRTAPVEESDDEIEPVPLETELVSCPCKRGACGGSHVRMPISTPSTMVGMNTRRRKEDVVMVKQIRVPGHSPLSPATHPRESCRCACCHHGNSGRPGLPWNRLRTRCGE